MLLFTFLFCILNHIRAFSGADFHEKPGLFDFKNVGFGSSRNLFFSRLHSADLDISSKIKFFTNFLSF